MAVGVGLFAVLVAIDPVGVGNFDTLVFWALGISVVIGELLPLEIPRRSGDGEVTISTMFSFALLLSAGLIPAVVAQAVASAIQDGAARKPFWRIGFNIGQYALTLMAAAAAISLAIGTQPPLGSRFHLPEVLATFAGAAAFYAVNLVLVTRATSLYEGTRLLHSLRSDMVFSLSVGAVLLCLAPIVVTILDFSPLLFPLFFIPLFGIYSSGRQAARA